MNNFEQEQKPIPEKKKLVKWDKKELMYGFIVIFLLLTVYFSGQMATAMLIETVQKACPTITVTSASPFGVSWVNGTPPHDNAVVTAVP